MNISAIEKNIFVYIAYGYFSIHNVYKKLSIYYTDKYSICNIDKIYFLITNIKIIVLLYTTCVNVQKM